MDICGFVGVVGVEGVLGDRMGSVTGRLLGLEVIMVCWRVLLKLLTSFLLLSSSVLPISSQTNKTKPHSSLSSSFPSLMVISEQKNCCEEGNSTSPKPNAKTKQKTKKTTKRAFGTFLGVSYLWGVRGLNAHLAQRIN